jgi:Na+/melibiose symporter-like transporter
MKEEELKISLANKIPNFGTTKNMILIALYQFFTIGMQFGVGGSTSGFLVYLGQYNMAYVWLQVSGIIANVFSVFISIFAGYFGDQIQSKYGRRKPLIFIGIIISLVSNFFLANLELFIEKTQISIVIWYVIFLVLGTIGGTMSTTSFNSWLLESTADENDFRNIQANCLSVPTYLGLIAGGLSINFLDYSMVVNIVFVPSLIAFVSLLWFLPNPICRKVERQPELIPSVRTCMRTKEFVAVFLNETLLMTAISVMGGVVNIYMQVGLTSNTGDYETLVIIQTVLGVILGLAFLLVLNWYLSSRDKLKIYLNQLRFIASAGIVGFGVSVIPGNVGNYLFFLFFFIIVVITPSVQLIDTLLVRDLVMFDTFTTGLNRESMYQTAISVPAGMISGAASSIPLIILYNTGYNTLAGASTDDSITDKHYEWNDGTIWQCRIYASLGLSIIAYASYYVLRSYPMTRDVSDKISEIVKSRMIKKSEAEEAKESSGGDVQDTDFRSSGLEEDELGVGNSIADNNDEMEMLHFSNVEVNAMASSPIEHGENVRLNEIRSYNTISILLSILAIVSLVLGIAIQLEKQQSNYAILLALAIQISSIYIMYEVLRRGVLNSFINLDAEELKVRAIASSKSNSTYGESLESLLSRNGITEVPDADNPNKDKLTRSLPDISSGYLPGYKRVFFLLSLFITIGILSYVIL